MQNVKLYIDEFLFVPILKTLVSFIKLFFIIITTAHWISCILNLIRANEVADASDPVIIIKLN